MKTWNVTPATAAKGYVFCKCPHCKLTIKVNLRAWLKASPYKTRPCTGCFRTFKLPNE